MKFVYEANIDLQLWFKTQNKNVANIRKVLNVNKERGSI
jgi:hypothetical protein